MFPAPAWGDTDEPQTDLESAPTVEKEIENEAPSEKGKPPLRGAVIIDLSPAFLGFIATDTVYQQTYFAFAAGYEHFLKNNYSAGIRAEFIIADYDYGKGVYFGLDAHWRIYPFAAFEKAFIDMSLGFNTAQVKDAMLFTGMTFGGKVGWKCVLVKRLFFEPSIGYYYSKYGVSYFPTIPLGWRLGAVLGVSL